MKTRLKICIFSAVFVLLVGIFLSQAYAFDDDVRVVGKGKQIVMVSPEPTIDCGEPGHDPHRFNVVQSSGLGATQNEQVTQDSRASQRSISNRYEALWQFLVFRIRQLFW